MIETNKKKPKSMFINFTSFKPVNSMKTIKKQEKGKNMILIIISFLKENIQMIQE